jgi:hypothetical protein
MAALEREVRTRGRRRARRLLGLEGPLSIRWAASPFTWSGDWTRRSNLARRNSSYFERDDDDRLKGYDDRPTLVEVVSPRTGERSQAVRGISASCSRWFVIAIDPAAPT